MKVLLTVLVVAIALISFGCATNSSQPGWYVGDDIKYNKKDYFLGRGQAATLAEAQNLARADLAKIFQVAIKVVGEDVQKYKNNSKDLGGGQFSVNSLQRITTYTEQVIRGIQIAETWQDPASKSIAVLAVLPRFQAEESLRLQIKSLDENIHSNIEQAKSNGDILARVSAASKAVAVQRERESLQSALQVIDITGRGVVSPYNSAKIKFDLEETLKQIRFSSRILKDSSPGLGEVMSGALTHAGFSIDEAEPIFLIKASLKLTDIGIVDGWYWQRGSLEVSVSETATGRVRGAQRWVIKGSGKDKVTAISRSLDEASDVLRKELGATIRGMANLK